MSSVAQACRARGNLPAPLNRFIDQLLHPQLPWHLILANMMSEVIRDDYDLNRHDRRYLTDGIYLPDIYNEGTYVACAIDTSGSMGDNDVLEAISETFGVLRSRNVTRIRLMSCDADVHYDQIFYPSDPPPTGIPGNGGTDFKPIFERLEDESERPAALIYFTDLYGSFPEVQPPYPTFWVTKTRNHSVPFGTIIPYRSLGSRRD